MASSLNVASSSIKGSTAGQVCGIDLSNPEALERVVRELMQTKGGAFTQDLVRTLPAFSSSGMKGLDLQDFKVAKLLDSLLDSSMAEFEEDLKTGKTITDQQLAAAQSRASYRMAQEASASAAAEPKSKPVSPKKENDEEEIHVSPDAEEEDDESLKPENIPTADLLKAQVDFNMPEGKKAFVFTYRDIEARYNPKQLRLFAEHQVLGDGFVLPKPGTFERLTRIKEALLLDYQQWMRFIQRVRGQYDLTRGPEVLQKMLLDTFAECKKDKVIQMHAERFKMRLEAWLSLLDQAMAREGKNPGLLEKEVVICNEKLKQIKKCEAFYHQHVTQEKKAKEAARKKQAKQRAKERKKEWVHVNALETEARALEEEEEETA